MKKHQTSTLLVVVVVVHSISTSLELLDFGGDVGLALFVGESLVAVPHTDRLPVFRLVSRLEYGVFPDSCVGVGVNLLDILGADAVSEVGRKLLFESVDDCKFTCENRVSI